jgi:protein-disulfide isomerase
MAAGSKDRRERAAAAREAAQAGEKRRERTVRIIGAAAVVVVVAGIIGAAVIARNSDSGSASGVEVVEPDPNAPVPEGAFGADSQWAYGVPYGTGSENVPVLELWEDFQCPACASLEEANGAGIAELAETGVVQLVWRPTGFLDRNLGNDASNRAIGAWGCAMDAGFTREFHDALYASVPEVEGDGWPNEDFIAIGEQIGISGSDLDTFEQCVDDGIYRPWAANSTQEFYDANVGGTPFGTINGQEVPNATLADRAALLAAVTEAAGS